MNTNFREFVRESNRIEGIEREPTDNEIATLREFVVRPGLTVLALVNFVEVYQPGAKLRKRPGMNVRVGNHVAPPGGPEIERRLTSFLHKVSNGGIEAHEAHIYYETLHPFMDGNGRSGRAVWLWQMKGNAPLGFLHTFYYQTLAASR